MGNSTTWHKITDIDHNQKIGTCSQCGTVSLVYRSKGAKFAPDAKQIICVNKYQERRVGLGKRDAAGRFLQKFTVGSEDDCWLWTGKKTTGKKPYGAMQIDNKTVLAHRYSYQHYNSAELSPYDSIHHKCSTPLCVNPKHLQASSRADNTLEMLERRYYVERIAELEAELALCRA